MVRKRLHWLVAILVLAPSALVPPVVFMPSCRRFAPWPSGNDPVALSSSIEARGKAYVVLDETDVSKRYIVRDSSLREIGSFPSSLLRASRFWVSDDSRIIAFQTASGLGFYALPEGRLIATTNHTNVRSVAFALNSQEALLLCEASPRIDLVDIRGNRVKQTWDVWKLGIEGLPLQVYFDNQHSPKVISGAKKHLERWDLEKKALETEFQGEVTDASPPNIVRVFVEQGLLIALNGEARYGIWSLGDGALIDVFNVGPWKVICESLVVSCEGKYVGYCCEGPPSTPTPIASCMEFLNERIPGLIGDSFDSFLAVRKKSFVLDVASRRVPIEIEGGEGIYFREDCVSVTTYGENGSYDWLLPLRRQWHLRFAWIVLEFSVICIVGLVYLSRRFCRYVIPKGLRQG